MRESGLKNILEVLQPIGFSTNDFRKTGAGGILQFDPEIISELMEEKRVEGHLFEKEHINDDPLRDGPVFIIEYDEENEIDIIYSEDPDILLKYLSKTYLGVYESKPVETLSLLVGKSVLEILLEYKSDFADYPTANILKWREHESPSFMTKEKRINISEIDNFCGMIQVCNYSRGELYCGDPLCHSDFTWIENGQALIYLETSCGDMTNVWLYPFHTNMKN